MGARMRTPATSVSKVRSYSPSKCDTSVEVPPMSKPMRRSKAGRAPGLRHPDHPAGRARQDRVLALEQLGRGEAARRHHEHERGCPVRVTAAAACLSKGAISAATFAT